MDLRMNPTAEYSFPISVSTAKWLREYCDKAVDDFPGLKLKGGRVQVFNAEYLKSFKESLEHCAKKIRQKLRDMEGKRGRRPNLDDILFCIDECQRLIDPSAIADTEIEEEDEEEIDEDTEDTQLAVNDLRDALIELGRDKCLAVLAQPGKPREDLIKLLPRVERLISIMQKEAASDE